MDIHWLAFLFPFSIKEKFIENEDYLDQMGMEQAFYMNLMF